MRCTSPKNVGFLADGKTLTWSTKKFSKEFATFQLPCGKCLACRLGRSRETAVRCVHESMMHKNNMFLTLTYNNENIGLNKLDYSHFQQFVKKLRHNIFQELLDELFPRLTADEQRKLWRSLTKQRRDELYGKVKISILSVGEYGTKNGRAHWHALVFNYWPQDSTLKYTSERGDRVYYSKSLEELWGRGIADYGTVTLESAGYCARYSLKKLAHGKDGEHDKEPISRRSSRQAIGKSWIEKYWRDVVNHGYIVLPGGEKVGVPRYYEKWLRVHQPAAWEEYLHKVKSKIAEEVIRKNEMVLNLELLENLRRSEIDGLGMLPVTTRLDHERIMLEQSVRFKNNNNKF